MQCPPQLHAGRAQGRRTDSLAQRQPQRSQFHERTNTYRQGAAVGALAPQDLGQLVHGAQVDLGVWGGRAEGVSGQVGGRVGGRVGGGHLTRHKRQLVCACLPGVK